MSYIDADLLGQFCAGCGYPVELYEHADDCPTLNRPTILEFTAAEWVVIKGRGDLAAIAKCHPDPRSLAGQLVKIDGDEYRVLGVETPATLEWSGDFGLFIGERKQ
jgi:hypothetical protein